MFRPCALPLRIDRPKIRRRRAAGRIVQRPRNARGEKYIRRVGLVHECEKWHGQRLAAKSEMMNSCTLFECTKTEIAGASDCKHRFSGASSRGKAGAQSRWGVECNRGNRKPVWTAFITTHIESQRWMRKAGPKTIHLADLQRFVFAEAYTPQLGPQGQHELQFESSRGKL